MILFEIAGNRVEVGLRLNEFNSVVQPTDSKQEMVSTITSPLFI